MTTTAVLGRRSDSTGAPMFTPDEPLQPPPHWVDPYNYGAAYHRTQAELTALRNEIRALIAAGRTKQGWVSCNVLEAALEAPR